ncbi:alpha/beta-hydrolase [Mycena sp. CBHHK59/15]|nr:alpha/beta-hydrolase [Mycena sp. CBHHK59/15]
MESATYASLRRQPFKSIYLLYQLANTLCRLPWWALAAIPRSWRPRRSWSWRRTVSIRLIRHMSGLSSIVGPLVTSPSYLAILPGIGFYGVWVEPVSTDLVAGKLEAWAAAADVAPVKLPGYWLHKKGSTIDVAAPLMPGEKIVYALHGGAYTRLSAHPTDPTAAIARGLLDRVDPVHRTFTIEYRLSSSAPYPAVHPFPTALLDALTGYNYLVNTLNFPPSDIIVEGDSAGGNLALALTRYLVENQGRGAPPTPGALLLLSPWCDVGTSHVYPGSSYFTCIPSDYIALPADGRHYSAIAFVGPFGLGAAELNPYISPASKNISSISFAGFPPTFILAGGAEILLDSIRTLKQKMAKDMGHENVRYLEAEDGVHDFIVFDSGWGEPERSEALTAIGKWVAVL